jgi:hypothetical protein
VSLKLPKPERRGPKPRRRIARRRRPSPVRRRANLGKLRQLADDLMSLYVRHRAGWVCWVCGSRRWWEMQMAHLIGKGAHPNGRYMEANVRCLCARCHKRYTHRPEEWGEYLRGRLGGGYDLLFDLVRVRVGNNRDYAAEVLYWNQRLLTCGNLQKVAERYDALRRRGVDLGVLAG